MQRHFDEELNLLKENLLRMAALAESRVRSCIDALVSRDEEIAKKVIESDEQINNMQMEVDETCLKLIALHQPTAIDLRFLTMTMKISDELERIGDLAVNIAECSQKLITEPLLKRLIDIPRMARLAENMVKSSIDAFVRWDAELAKTVCENDNEVDGLKDQILRELLTYMMEDQKTITRAIELILVSRHLERIADHATNIAEDVIYMVKGEDIRHHAMEKIK
ncbi:phosphate transport system regulatory protein PhoU [bacterium Unc6]|nr:phosphate transport system regulatory protein PhoU [bacterium Unc6]